MGKKRRVFAAKAKFGRKHSHLYRTENIKEPTIEVKAEPTPVIEIKEEIPVVEIKAEPAPIIEAKAEPVLQEKPKKKPVRKRRTRTTRKKTTTKSKE